MKKEYECHDCGGEFVLPEDEEPSCPECSSQNLTFEGYREATLAERGWRRIRPAINFWFMPWKFFADRSIKILNSHILMVLSVSGLLAATWQVQTITGGSSPQLFKNFLSVFRNYSAFSNLLVRVGRFGEFFPAPLVVFVLLVFVEFIAFETFNFIQWFLGGEGQQAQTGLLFSASIWIPNILLGTFTFIVARGASMGYWSPVLLTGLTVRLAGWIIALWCLYIFLGGCFALPGLKLASAPALPPLTLAGQFLLVFIFIFLLNSYALPFLNLPGAVAEGGLLEVLFQLLFYPFYLPFF